MTKLSDYMTGREAAEFLSQKFNIDYSLNTFRNMYVKGLIPSVLVGKTRLYPRDFIESYIPKYKIGRIQKSRNSNKAEEQKSAESGK